MALRIKVQVKITAEETASADLASPRAVHVFEYDREFLNGTTDASSQFDTVWSDSRTANGNDDLDLQGGLTGVFGNSLTFADCGLLAFHNTSTTSGQTLTLGNGSNPAYSGLFGAATHTITGGADSLILVCSPINSLTTTAGTADILRAATSASLTYKALLAGRSA